jgi:hypothetical protein
MQLQQRSHLLAALVRKVRKTPAHFGKGHQLIAHSIELLLIATTDFHLAIGAYVA